MCFEHTKHDKGNIQRQTLFSAPVEGRLFICADETHILVWRLISAPGCNVLFFYLFQKEEQRNNKLGAYSPCHHLHSGSSIPIKQRWQFCNHPLKKKKSIQRVQSNRGNWKQQWLVKVSARCATQQSNSAQCAALKLPARMRIHLYRCICQCRGRVCASSAGMQFKLWSQGSAVKDRCGEPGSASLRGVCARRCKRGHVVTRL